MALRINADPERIRTYRVRLYPNNQQQERIEEMISLSRYVYNWAIAEINSLRDKGERCPGSFELNHSFMVYRKGEGLEWLRRLPTSHSVTQIFYAVKSFMNFFRKSAGRPSFRSRLSETQSFTAAGENVKVEGEYIRIPGFGYGVGFKRKDAPIYAGKHNIPVLPKGKYYYRPTVSRDKDGRYWLTIGVERPLNELNKPKSKAIGIDVGVRTLITTSDGDTYNFPDCKKLEKKKLRQIRHYSKDQERLLAESKRTKTKYRDLPKSKNMLKREAATRKTYQKIKNIQDNYIHNVTKQIVEKNPEAIVIEDIIVRDMLSKKNPISRNLQHDKPQMKFGMIHHCLSYKAKDRGIKVIVAPKDYPSTKKCSNCGKINDIGASKTYKCPHCGYREDRDLNAAYNLRNLAYQ